MSITQHCTSQGVKRQTQDPPVHAHTKRRRRNRISLQDSYRHPCDRSNPSSDKSICSDIFDLFHLLMQLSPSPPRLRSVKLTVDKSMKELVYFEGDWSVDQIEALIELRFKDYKDISESDDEQWESLTREWNHMQEFEVFSTKQIKDKLNRLYKEYREIQIILDVFMHV